MPEKRTLDNPLTGEDRKTLKSVKRRLGKVMEFVEKLEAAGINCDERRGVCEAINEMVDGIQRQFPEVPVLKE